MKLELFPDVAPITAENFLTLIDNKFYDNLLIDVIEKNIKIQRGTPNYNTVDPIVEEFYKMESSNNLSHFRGVILSTKFCY